MAVECKMCRKALFEKNFLTYASWKSMQLKASFFLRILDVYSHTKLNTPVLVWSLQLSNFGLTHVTEHFSVTIDCVRFLIRRFPLYTYSMVISKTLENFLVIQKHINFVEIFIRKTIHYSQTSSIDHTSLILVVNPDYNSTVFVLFFFLWVICGFFWMMIIE